MMVSIAGKIVNDWVREQDTSLISALVGLISASKFNISFWKLLIINSVHYVEYIIRLETLDSF